MSPRQPHPSDRRQATTKSPASPEISQPEPGPAGEVRERIRNKRDSQLESSLPEPRSRPQSRRLRDDPSAACRTKIYTEAPRGNADGWIDDALAFRL
jgi:hypothetical protein